MDILSARKKAAELARARKNSVQEPVAAEQAAVVQQTTPETVHAPAPAPPAVPDAGVEAPPAEAAAEAAVSENAPDEKPEAQEIEMLSFRLGEEEYALMVDDVKEVLKNRELTPVPNTPDYIRGVTALRGPILPVIDLCTRLGIPAGVRDEKSRILVVNLKEDDIGIIVDRVTGVVKIRQETIRPVPETIEHGAEFLRGIARKDDKLYILLDREKALGA